MPELWNIGPNGPDPMQSSEIVQRLESGGVLLLPTDTIYGIHGRALDPSAVRRIFAIKGREQDKPLPVLFASIAQLKALGAVLSPRAEDFLGQTWPAPLTALVELQRSIPATAGSTTVAARVPAVGWLRQLLLAAGPLASTSANVSGQAPACRVSDVPAEVRGQLDGIVDSGRLTGLASTIIDLSSDPPILVRQGEFVFRQKLWKKVRKTL
jgi:L-threonylcarbamoyladenylate synthase